ncbi:AfsR/SARP family transcriptional regulator [Streptomyces humi]|uniref:AfsR/SARP family transcriptional regulator n=1 Tax=Streptomyces humi TaxID=1428620 RepID=UPI0006286BAF|nr:tetratricopeptide repeat protein [Streptomyces humi]
MPGLSHDARDHAVRFSVLGPVRVWQDGSELLLGPKQQRLILAVLLARAGRPVSMHEFVDLLWDGEPPSSATNAVHRYVGALRRLLEPGLPARSPGRWLARQAGGYMLRVDADCLDLLGFRALVDQARQAEVAGDSTGSVGLFITALSLWQGRCAADLEPVSGSHPSFVMLEHEYVSVVCEAADTALRCRRAEAVLLPLRQAAERNPLDEALLARLLLVLAADGKQAEALTTYAEIRLRLAEELSVDPGSELRAAHERILRHRLDAGLPPETTTAEGGETAASAPAVPAPSILPSAPSARTVRPAQLPPDLPVFTGREEALAQARSVAARGGGALRVLAVDGIPGVGKTTLAVRFAHQVAAEFPDGQLHADLRGFTPDGKPADPTDILQSFLDALGVAPQRVPARSDARAALYRTVMADRRVLVVLDNAHDLAQVRPLLPGTGHCMVVVTSRSRLTALATAHGAHLLTLDVPGSAEAADVFLERVRASRPHTAPHEIRPLVERCGRLPLAVAVLAARAAAHPERPLHDIDQELSATDHSLDAFSDDNLDNDVRGVFSWSYRTLGPKAAHLFRLLPLHPGPDVTVAALATMAGITPREAACAVGELVRARLLTAHGRDRYWAHDLILAYAAELAVQYEPDRPAVRSRVYDHYRQTAHVANLLLRPGPQPAAPASPLPSVTPEPLADPAAATAWYTRERAVLRSVVEATAAHGDSRMAWELALTLQLCQQRMGWWHDWAATMRSALAAARRTEDAEGQARTHHGLAGALHHLGDLPNALRHLERARHHFEQLRSTTDLAHVLRNIGLVHHTQGDHVRALRHLERALELLDGPDADPLKATILSMAGMARVELGDLEEALRLLRTAVAMFHDMRDLNGEGLTLTVIGQVHRRRRDHARSVLYYERGIELLRLAGSRANVAEELMALGEVRLDARDVPGARRAWTDALRSLEDPDLPLALRVRRKLTRLDAATEQRPAASVN